MKTKRQAGDIDKVIAGNLKAARMRRAYSQQDMARALDISYQQFQKYETGQNRISAASLYRVACWFDMPMERFFVISEG